MMYSFLDLTVLVDKRITLGAFKGELEPHVGTTSDNFKVQVYSTHIPLKIMNVVKNKTEVGRTFNTGQCVSNKFR